MHTAETMSRSFEKVGDPVLVLWPHGSYIDVYQTKIPQNLKNHPTVWCREFKVRPTQIVYMFSKPSSALLCTRPHAGQENVFMTTFCLYHRAPPSGVCYMQFKINDAITDATAFLNAYKSHSNNLANCTLKDFLMMFHDNVQRQAAKVQVFLE